MSRDSDGEIDKQKMNKSPSSLQMNVITEFAVYWESVAHIIRLPGVVYY